MDLPELGVGLIYSSSVDRIVEAGNELIDVLEIEPQMFWSAPDGRHRETIGNQYRPFLRFPQPKVLHGVGFPIGGTVATDGSEIPLLRETIRMTSAPWMSEHLGFNRICSPAGQELAGFLLPPIQNADSVAQAAANIRRIRAELELPFAFETGVNYLRPRADEMSDGRFFASVAKEADCGILLDLHNLWCNERNGRQSVLDVVDELPLESVWEVHLAGGSDLGGYLLDAHSGLVPEPVMQLAELVIPRLPNVKAVVFEIIGDYVDSGEVEESEILHQLQRMRGLWALRRPGRAARVRPRPGHMPPPNSSPTPGEWELALGQLVLGRAPATGLAAELALDPGVDLYVRLARSVRAGMLVESLRLTYRYLALQLGRESVDRLQKEFWSSVAPANTALDEAVSFRAFLATDHSDLGRAVEIADFELARHRVRLEGAPLTVRFSCEPLPLLEALRDRHLPEDIRAGDFELTIQP